MTAEKYFSKRYRRHNTVSTIIQGSEVSFDSVARPGNSESSKHEVALGVLCGFSTCNTLHLTI